LDCAGFVGDQLVTAHVGDGRFILVRDGTWTALSRDHTRAEEMVSSGLWNAEQLRASPFRQELTRSIGAASVVVPDLSSLPLQPGDRVLLCTNGFSDTLTGASDEEALRMTKEPRELAKRLVSLAHQRQTTDNATLIALVVPDAEMIQDQTQGKKILENPALMDALANVTVFQAVRRNRRAMVSLLSLASTREYAPGETLMRQGDPSPEMIVILDGLVEVLSFGNVIAERRGGEALGEVGFFTRAPRTASVIAKKPTRVLTLNIDDFHALLSRDPHLGLELARGVIFELGRKLVQGEG
jgi:hypothetical protein